MVNIQRNGDETIVAAFSKELNGFGFKIKISHHAIYRIFNWKKNNYKGVNEAIVDVNIQTPHKSRLFTMVSVAIPVDILLTTEDIHGKTR